MVLAAGAMPSLALILATLVGGTLAAGAANAMNMYLDRDIDQVMRRTRQRPLPRHRIEPDAALRFGFALAAFAYRVPRGHRERAGRAARAVGDRLLRLRLHDVAEALDRPEHRDRRRGRRRARAGRVGGGDRVARAARDRAVRRGVRLDPAAFLGAGAADAGRLRGGRACRCCRSSAARTRPGGRSSCTRSCCSPSTLLLVPIASMGPVYIGDGGGARRGVRVPVPAAVARRRPTTGRGGCSSSRCSTWPGCSSPSRSTRSSDRRAPGRAAPRAAPRSWRPARST